MSGVGMRASPITITITVAILVTGCWLHPARAQVAPNVPALEPSTARDLEGKVVREIRIAQGLRPSTVDIVRRHLASRQGMPFHQATLLEDRRRLDALRLFSAIEIRPVAAGDEVVLEVDVKETLRLLPYVALSVTDENGLSGGPGVQRHQPARSRFADVWHAAVRWDDHGRRAGDTADRYPRRVGSRRGSRLPIAAKRAVRLR